MNKHIWKIDVAVVFASIFVLLGTIGYVQPLMIAPLDYYESVDGNVLFEFYGADVLLIDDNIDFTTPDNYNVDGSLNLSLEPGIYYWKTGSVLGSEVRTLTVNSRIELRLIEDGENIVVVNAGNVGLNVDVYDEDEFLGKVKLGVGEELDEDGDKFIGGLDE